MNNKSDRYIYFLRFFFLRSEKEKLKCVTGKTTDIYRNMSNRIHNIDNYRKFTRSHLTMHDICTYMQYSSYDQMISINDIAYATGFVRTFGENTYYNIIKPLRSYN